MPLVIIAGRPCTGKTTFAQILRDFLITKTNQKVVLVNEESLKIHKRDGYATSNKEKDTRGGLKSAVEHNLTPDTYVILDSLNYIKGYRYELYCTARTMRTPHCVIWVACDEQYSTAWNQARIELHAEDGYDPAIMADIRKRFEIPNDNNRWDNPLFKVNMNPVAAITEASDASVNSTSTTDATAASSNQASSTAVTTAASTSSSSAVKTKTSWKPKSKAAAPIAVPENVFTQATEVSAAVDSAPASNSTASSSSTAALSFSGSMVVAVDDISSFNSPNSILEDVYRHLSAQVTIVPNCSTVTPLHASADLLYELDRTSQKIIQLIVVHQTDQVEGTPIQLLEYDRALTLHRPISLSELQRFRRQFVKINAQHPPSSSKLIGASFVDFLASQI